MPSLVNIYDPLVGELVKYAADKLDTSVAAIFNQALEHHQTFVLAVELLQKPRKPIGDLLSLISILLLTT